MSSRVSLVGLTIADQRLASIIARLTTIPAMLYCTSRSLVLVMIILEGGREREREKERERERGVVTMIEDNLILSNEEYDLARASL